MAVTRHTTEPQDSGALQAHRVLVAGAAPDESALVTYHLARAGYRVSTAATGHEVIETACEERPALVVLDTMIAGPSGHEVLAELRQRDQTKDIGVLLLTGREQDADRIRGLTLGADDCLVKPFAAEEMVLHVRAILRRMSAPGTTSARLAAGPVVLDRTAHRVLVDGREVRLTTTEFKLLHALMLREGRVLTRAQLLETVWGAPPDVTTRTVDMHMQRLRHKLGMAGAFIATVRGTGYRFERPTPSHRARSLPRASR
jgi:two-component system phosphate regulon response regulator PhoB